MRIRPLPPVLVLAALAAGPAQAQVSGSIVRFDVTGTATNSPSPAGPGDVILAPGRLRITVVDVYIGALSPRPVNASHTIDIPVLGGYADTTTARIARDSLVTHLITNLPGAGYTVALCGDRSVVQITNPTSFTFGHSIVDPIFGQTYAEFLGPCVPVAGPAGLGALALVLAAVGARRVRRMRR
jgi:hypothetical protein